MEENEVRTLADLAARANEAWPDAVWLKEKDGKAFRQCTFSAFYDHALRISAFLKEQAVSPLHVGIIGPTSISYIECLFGTWLSGGVTVPIDAMLPAEEIIDNLVRADVSVFCYDSRFAPLIPALKQAAPKIRTICFSKTVQDESVPSILNRYEPAAPAEIDPAQCACILYTSGTTGKSKGVMLSHCNLIDNVMCCDQEGSSDSVLLTVLPLHHAYCLTCDLLLSMRYGARLCINDSLMRIPQNIKLFEPTMILVVPMIAETLYRRIAVQAKAMPGVTMAEAGRALFGPKLTNLFCGGAYLSPQLSAAYAEMGIPILQGYGMTECSPRIASSSLADPSTGEDVGRVVKNCEIRIDDGEIQVRSPSVMMGYYHNPEAEQEMFTEDGWLKTGDLGYVKEDRVYITGRRKNLIILSNGENISPELIENRFSDCDWLAEILVYAEGEQITAEVYPRPEFAADAEQLFRAKAEEINRSAPAARRITRLRLRDQEFDKTTSRKIRRIQSGEKGRILE